MKILIVLVLACIFPCFAQLDSSKLILPRHFTYQGAFKLPDSADYRGDDGVPEMWGFGAMAITYKPTGDPYGPNDGYPGSIFGTGHVYGEMVSEITIPEPVISRNLNDLNYAHTLQGFHDVLGFSLSEWHYFWGLQYMPPKGQQTTEKIYGNWGYYWNHESLKRWSLGVFETNLSAPDFSGLWNIGDLVDTKTSAYLCEIPQTWADQHTNGMSLGAGRFRVGQSSGTGGPSLYACAPWLDGNPPPNFSTISAETLLQYTETNPLKNFKGEESDCWQGDYWGNASWLTSGSRSAVLINGRKQFGTCWYDGGYFSTEAAAYLMFYNPDDLAAVATGTMQPYEPQPYAVIDFTDVLYEDSLDIQIRGGTYDRINNILYVVEYGCTGPFYSSNSVVHVWKIDTESSKADANDVINAPFKIQATPNPFNPATTIQIQCEKAGMQQAEVNIYNLSGNLVSHLSSSPAWQQDPLTSSYVWNASNQPSGIYILKAKIGNQTVSKTLTLLK